MKKRFWVKVGCLAIALVGAMGWSLIGYAADWSRWGIAPVNMLLGLLSSLAAEDEIKRLGL